MRVFIFQPAKTATQSGRAREGMWLVEPEAISARTPEPLMGWASSHDTASYLKGRMRFGSMEEAVSFAGRQGWDYVLSAPSERRVVPKSYMDNFKSKGAGN